MKQFTIALGLMLATLLTMLAGCDEPQPIAGPPPVRIAAEDRVANYGPSCVHATGGEHASGLRAKMRASGVDYAACTSGSIDWVRVTLESGQPIGVAYPVGHMQTAYRIDDKYIYLLDNNDTGSPRGVPLTKFERHWMGWAFALPKPSHK
jgi:hypothetical protein